MQEKLTESQINSLFRRKAKESFKTKLNLFIFNFVINKKSDFDNDSFDQYKINQEDIDLYTTQYYQMESPHTIQGVSVEDIYKKMVSFKTEKFEQIKKLEKSYEESFKELFTLDAFKKLLEPENKRCYYCDITVDIINELANKHKLYKKNERGWKLEIDRKKPNEEYKEENCVLACYWCNNAKTDEFTDEEFKPIGQAIKKVWENRLGIKIN